MSPWQRWPRLHLRDLLKSRQHRHLMLWCLHSEASCMLLASAAQPSNWHECYCPPRSDHLAAAAQRRHGTGPQREPAHFQQRGGHHSEAGLPRRHHAWCVVALKLRPFRAETLFCSIFHSFFFWEATHSIRWRSCFPFLTLVTVGFCRKLLLTVKILTTGMKAAAAALRKLEGAASIRNVWQ